MTLTTEEIILNAERKVRLTVMLQSVGGEFQAIQKRPAVLILPGGGYLMCSDREAEVVAYPFLQAGYHAFVLRYSVGQNKDWPNPLEDYEQTMELLLEKSEEWHVLTDKIAVIGFSAGGHLAACAATMAKYRPNAAILGYAALEQDIVSACQPDMDIPVPVDSVDDKTPPCFLFAARDDMTVPVHNTLRFEMKLEEHGIQFESHIYAYGGHGYGTGIEVIAGLEISCRIGNWVQDAIGWLEDIFGKLSLQGMGKPTCPRKMGDFEDRLSVRCSYGYLKRQPDAEEALKDGAVLIENYINEALNGTKGGRYIVESAAIQEMLLTVGYSAERLIKLEEILQKIPNVRNGFFRDET